MYYVMDAHSFYNFIYFILLIIVSVLGSAGEGQSGIHLSVPGATGVPQGVGTG